MTFQKTEPKRCLAAAWTSRIPLSRPEPIREGANEAPGNGSGKSGSLGPLTTMAGDSEKKMVVEGGGGATVPEIWGELSPSPHDDVSGYVPERPVGGPVCS